MESFFSRYKNPLVLALVLMVEFVLLAVQVKPRLPGAAVADQAGVNVLRAGVTSAVTPPEKVLHESGLSFRGVWSSYINLINVKEQNRELQAENQRLQLEQAALAEDARQGQRLQELLAFKQHYVDNTVPAQVVGTGGTDHGRILYIDKGSDDGIAVEMPVITPDGIVGKVREVTAHASQVLEISDPTSATGVLLEQTRTRGILRGDGVGHAQITNMMPDDRIKPGQLVLTSGGDQIFPRGLPVGTVDRVVPDVDNQPLVDVVLKPAANLGRLEEVLVVTGTASAPSARARRDLARSEGTAAAVKAAEVAKAAAAAKAEAALEAQRASDILAQRLPSASNVENPDSPDASPGSSPETADSNSAPLHPPSALHKDHYTPGAVPSADNLTPGQRLGPYAEGIPTTDRAVKSGNGDDAAASLPSPSISPAFRAAHDAAVAARPKPTAPAAPATAAATHTPSAPAANGATAAGTLATGAAAGVQTVLRPVIRREPILNPDGTPMLNADGTHAVKRIPVLNPDGTPMMHRVPVTPPASATATPAAGAPATGTASAASAAQQTVLVPVVRREPILKADGTPLINADGTHAVKRIPVLNPDGTPMMHRVPVNSASSAPRPASASGAIATAPRPAATTAAPRPATTPATANRPAQTPGTAGRVAPRAGVPTTIIDDGPLPGAGARPRTTTQPGAQPQHRTKPSLVPDDGSRPPSQPAPQGGL